MPRLDLFAASSEVAWLNANENPYGPSPRAKQAMLAAVNRANRYAPDDDVAALRGEIAKRENVAVDSIVLGAGSSEILGLAALAFLGGGGELLTAERTFGLLPMIAQRMGIAVVRSAMTEKQEYDLRALDSKTRSATRLIYVVNPNNPTGTWIEGAQLSAFVEEASRRAPVLVDEAYLEYVDPKLRRSMVDHVHNGRNVIISRTFSKIHGLAGMRIGYAVAKPELAQLLSSVRVGLLNNVGVAAARAALHDTAFQESSRHRNNDARETLCAALKRLQIPHAESHASFVWYRPGRADIAQLLAKEGVRVPSSATANANGWARVTVGRPTENLRFVQALEKIL